MRTPKECAKVFGDIFQDETKNGGYGAYCISREELKQISGRPLWHQTIIEDVADWLVDLGLILVNRDGRFYIMEPSELDRYLLVDSETLEKHSCPVVFGDAKKA